MIGTLANAIVIVIYEYIKSTHVHLKCTQWLTQCQLYLKKKESPVCISYSNAESWEWNNWLHRGTKMKGCDDWLGIQVRFHWELPLRRGGQALVFAFPPFHGMHLASLWCGYSYSFSASVSLQGLPPLTFQTLPPTPLYIFIIYSTSFV